LSFPQISHDHSWRVYVQEAFENAEARITKAIES